jgi:glycosyltransferase involved in cell wall biosynthesis
LWYGLSDYLNACLKELAARRGVELFVSHLQPVDVAPFAQDQFLWIDNQLMWRSEEDLATLQDRLDEFAPHVEVFSGWAVSAYRKVAKKSSGKCLRIMTMDNCWLATTKQRLATLIAPWYVRPLADYVWLPGERQATFAKKLGFGQQHILRGLYSCDQPELESIYLSRVENQRPLPQAFVYVGRLVPEKGIDTLVEAYELYRRQCVDPWPLICCGTGPLRAHLENRPGIQIEGFLQAEALRTKLAGAGCLVLPSNFEPWAVVVHEAAAAGLLILASESVGASVHLVQDSYNGYLFERGNSRQLAALMSHVTALTNAQRSDMSQASHSLSRQFTPRRWADTLLQAAERFSATGQSNAFRRCSVEEPVANPTL